MLLSRMRLSIFLIASILVAALHFPSHSEGARPSRRGKNWKKHNTEKGKRYQKKDHVVRPDANRDIPSKKRKRSCQERIKGKKRITIKGTNDLYENETHGSTGSGITTYDDFYVAPRTSDQKPERLRPSQNPSPYIVKTTYADGTTAKIVLEDPRDPQSNWMVEVARPNFGTTWNHYTHSIHTLGMRAFELYPHWLFIYGHFSRKKYVEIGVGRGQFFLELLSLGADITGTDLVVAPHLEQRPNLIDDDFVQTRLPADRFDVAFSNGRLFRARNKLSWGQYIVNFHYILKENGEVWAYSPHANEFNDFVEMYYSDYFEVDRGRLYPNVMHFRKR